jgi:hypothetical protein
MRKLLIITLLFSLTFTALRVAKATDLLELTGRISPVGPAPYTKTALHTPGPQTYLVDGRWLPELNNLRGATVKVKGRVIATDPSYQLPRLEITEYQLLAIDNGSKTIKPWVGTINGETTLFLTTSAGKTFELKGPLAATLGDQIGAKVWIIGSTHHNGFFGRKVIVPDAYGIIRPVKS